MKNVLTLADKNKAQPNDELIDYLTNLLAQAMDGELQGMVAVEIYSDLSTARAMMGRMNTFLMYPQVAMIKETLMVEMLEAESMED